MNDEIVYQDGFIKIYKFSEDLYIESLKSGITLNQLNSILTSNPQFQIIDFNVIKDAVNNAPRPPKKFGVLKERIVIKISEDELKATIIFNLSKSELDLSNREAVVKEAYEALGKHNVNFGIKRELFFGELEPGKPYVIAEGERSIDGKDSEIKMYELSERKPEIREDGKADYYELKLINRVKAGDWLGERIEATDGFPGRTVTGMALKAAKGKNFPLLYDKNSVYEVMTNNKTVLYSKFSGAVNYIDGKITVSNHLVIDGDVDFNTGNIEFDGYVTVNGTVMDGFSIIATKDIEINSPLGLGNVKGIKSLEGSIFIKGGIVAKDPFQIIAKNDIFTKFANNVALTCGGIAHIGFYCINSNVTAKEVFIESTKGNIIGGNIKAEMKVTAPVIGSSLEVKTVIEVTGFNRSALSKELESITNQIDSLKNEQVSIKQELSTYIQNEMSSVEAKLYNKKYLRAIEIKEELKACEHKRKSLNRCLRTKGDGEINISKKVFPNCILIIKNLKTEIKSPSIGTTLYYSDGELKYV